jgi:hypothetical protein
MAVYGPVRHQKNIIWTEANIFLVTDRSIYCHMTLDSDVCPALIYNILYVGSCFCLYGHGIFVYILLYVSSLFP